MAKEKMTSETNQTVTTNTNPTNPTNPTPNPTNTMNATNQNPNITTMPKSAKRITASEFIEAFQSSNDYDEVTQKTGLNLANVKNREKNYREKMGIPLKVFVGSTRKRGLDVEALRRLAEKFQQNQTKTS